MKALIIICAVTLLYNCTPLRSADVYDISSSSFKALEAKARDNGENNPLRTTSRRRGGGSSGGSSGGTGTGGGGQPILGTFCSDCQKLVTCLEDATTSTQHLLKGWYYFCPTEADFCLELVGWASYQLTENKFREWIRHQRSRDQIPDVATAPEIDTPREHNFYGTLYDCMTTKGKENITRDTGCETTHTGDQTAIDTCKANSKKTYFVDIYQCWADYYEHRSDFFCD